MYVADYYHIYQAHYKNNDINSFIDEVRTSHTNDAKIRTTLIADIESGVQIKTALWDDSDNDYKEGKDVNALTIDGVKYLRTDKNYIKKDYLENIPIYKY
jgi:hypothetical protein